jgi:hypothetical protein
VTGTRNGCVARLQLVPNQVQVVLTVPADNTLVLKHVAVWNDSPTGGTFGLYAQTPDGDVHANLISADVPGAGGLEWTGWIALNPGDQITVYTAVAGVHLWASGAVLPGQADLPLPAGELVSTPPATPR